MSEKKSNSLYEDRQDHIPQLETPKIEWFQNVYAGEEYKVEFTIPEFTAVCPKTGLPDFGTIMIEYIPREKCLELKSLKEYFLAYRNIGIFHENVVNKVLEDLVKAVDPMYLKVVGDYNVRGGVKTIVRREYIAT
ncbi:7-cyano-7-deazaguanine reductase [Leptospira ryugenii]|uniref:NADPH-dependent 7-cyano-7-deazaguanine reductase n=1 Tax=Leptospira ryugenii TaxID=1917863 RepID=A0A2P2DWQ9_9LEPT|nr:preQ(1) synthase [Leptospira ryugenii]GBF49010.1 7-cyano-7-deazaguanine reductase [Leptospira ryugenii]